MAKRKNIKIKQLRSKDDIDPKSRASLFNIKIPANKLKFKECLHRYRAYAQHLSSATLSLVNADINCQMKTLYKKYGFNYFTPKDLKEQNAYIKLERKINISVFKQVLKFLSTRQIFKLKTLKDYYNCLNIGKRITIKSVKDLLKNLGYRFKKSGKSISNSQDFTRLAQLYYFSTHYSYVIRDEYTVFYLDEVQIGSKIKDPYQWVPSNNIGYAPKKKWLERCTAIVAISTKGVFHYELEYGNLNSERFLKFMINLDNKVKSHKIFSELYELGKIAYFMDNASQHRSKTFYNNFSYSKAKIIYNIPFRPEFNPIELLFNYVKQKIRNSFVDSLSARILIMEQCFLTIEKSILRKFVMKSINILINNVENQLK